ncbi:MAG: hypothetical protein HY211_01215 [Candidatus Omnitrophica bacterium]|nr:hypothetical protein [Candidatus Omnitrophota bacterium]
MRNLDEIPSSGPGTFGNGTGYYPRFYPKAMTAKSVDNILASIELPLSPAELYRELDMALKDRDPYDFVADRGAKKARECWVASQFLETHSQRTCRRYQITNIVTEAPDVEYRDTANLTEILSIEVAELLSPDRRRSEEYLREKEERETCARENREYSSNPKDLSQEFLEKEKAQFPIVAAQVLEEKLVNSYGPNCTLILYVGLRLFGREPILSFIKTYRFTSVNRFREIWFLYNRGDIIPLQESASQK